MPRLQCFSHLSFLKIETLRNRRLSGPKVLPCAGIERQGHANLFGMTAMSGPQFPAIDPAVALDSA